MSERHGLIGKMSRIVARHPMMEEMKFEMEHDMMLPTSHESPNDARTQLDDPEVVKGTSQTYFSFIIKIGCLLLPPPIQDPPFFYFYLL
jgi:hypothetical protein